MTYISNTKSISFCHFTEYTAKMLEMVVCKASGDMDSSPIIMPVDPPSLCHEATHPELSDAVAAYVSRFKK